MHLIWMERGYAFLAGRPVDLPSSFVRNDDLCPVGNWLRDRLDKRFCTLALFGETNSVHEAFHVILDELFSADIDCVPTAIADRFHEVGDDLTRLLEEWVEIGKNGVRS